MPSQRALRRVILIVVLALGRATGSEHLEIGTNFWDVGWGSGSADPFVDGFQNVSGDNPWRPEFLEDIAHYTVFRFMDWGKANNADREGITGRWADRTQKDDPLQRPMAYEWMIDLCNRMQADMWVCVPHVADQEYWRSLAQLVHDNLDPTLRCYVEHSNETWNGMFTQANYVMQRGLEVGIDDGNQWYRGQKYQAWVSFRIWKEFVDVFEGERHRLVTVMGSTHIHAFAETHLQCAQDPFYNPHDITLDALADAPYLGSGINGSSGDAIEQLYAKLAEGHERQAAIKQACDNAGVEFVCYEAGQHVINGADVVNARPEIYGLYRAYLDSMSHYFPLLVHYAHAGEWGSGGAWGAKRFIGQSIDDAHKYRALYDYAVESGQYQEGAERPVRIRTADLFEPFPSSVVCDEAGPRPFTVARKRSSDRGRVYNLLGMRSGGMRHGRRRSPGFVIREPRHGCPSAWVLLR